MKKITIVHIFPDDKFFDKFAEFYDSLDGVDNKYVFYTKARGYRFKLIKNTSRITVVNSIPQYIRLLRDREVDIVLFHTMCGIKYFLASILRKKTKVIWWSWGYDLYHYRNHMPPIVRLEMYKPRTKRLMEIITKPDSIHNIICENTVGLFYTLLRNIAMSRVNLFLPVCQIEYSLLKDNCKYFNGNLAIYPSDEKEYPPKWFLNAGNVLVGNSLTYTNNHLDVFQYLYNIQLDSGRKFVIPVSYGGDYMGPDHLISLSDFKYDNVLWLKKFLNIDEYMTLFNTVTHAIFGMIRQQAMGNVIYCLRSGVKIYLFKDSVIAKQLKKDGYVFFSIEDDLNEDSLNTCLSKDDAVHNICIYNELEKNRGRKEVREQLVHLVEES